MTKHHMAPPPSRGQQRLDLIYGELGEYEQVLTPVPSLPPPDDWDWKTQGPPPWLFPPVLKSAK